jgi:hypothetical protein
MVTSVLRAIYTILMQRCNLLDADIARIMVIQDITEYPKPEEAVRNAMLNLADKLSDVVCDDTIEINPLDSMIINYVTNHHQLTVEEDVLKYQLEPLDVDESDWIDMAICARYKSLSPPEDLTGVFWEGPDDTDEPDEPE